ncbi:hypothetical protein PCIT_a2080 [Pseudoalteromonas citrea]|uniref:Uncharacterized protein n=1 Tax=Pseudoalteromonas citrea TaxID=43655 RepID=A0AAD4AJ81_9GAMM|nr:hypothetical protein PCIT_a2080 [Pseudoalteromonas citrea]
MLHSIQKKAKFSYDINVMKAVYTQLSTYFHLMTALFPK